MADPSPSDPHSAAPGRLGGPSAAIAYAISSLAADLGTDAVHGLTTDAARRRLDAEGRNEVEPPPRPTLPKLILEAATEPFVLLLLLAGLAAIALGEVRDGLLVLAGLVPIVGADVVTEYRAERALAELHAAAAPTAIVRRDNRAIELPAADVVRGDVVLVRAGDIVPADLRLTAAVGLAFDRSLLTGESMPEAAALVPDPEGVPPAEQRSVAFAGTSVVRGSGEGITIATGPRTALGRIAGGMAGSESRRSPLQRELDRLVRILLVVALGLIAITIGAGVVRGQPAGANLLAGISAAIAAIPEEPPILLAVILGLGAHRLLRRNVLVRRLSAEETLGAVDLILTDKTGTLTQNRLGLAAVLRPGGEVSDPVERGRIIAMAFRAEDDAWRSGRIGPPRGSFARALHVALGEANTAAETLDPADLVESRPPDDSRPFASTSARRDDRTEHLALGAPEAVLARCPELGTEEREGWQALIEGQATRGGRLLLLARAVDDTPWRPVAILAFADPLRDDVRAALDTTRAAGIHTIVVTGDHPATATAIAADAGLATQRVITGAELATWDDARLDGELVTLDVVARALPEDKLRLVDAGRRIDRTVAVTGDGVNDAPALQRGDVAVAMGSGSAVAKGASDLVLNDDSFATLVFAIRDGRRIVANVQKGLVFLISTHVALLGFILIATLVGFGQPLLPIQILWLELFIDVSTSVAFEREAEEPGAMAVKPRPRRVPLLTTSLLLRIALAGGFSAAAAVVLLVAHDGGADHARWLAYTSLVVAQAVRAYANRSLTRPLAHLATNRFLLAACVAVVVIQAAIPAIPALASIFRATPLDALDWLLVAAIAFAPLILAESIRRRTGRVWVA
ncbi:MAG TPA: HAD-IC family P-type ATPase [Candidatus Limnocylindrales bacterium]|nr:HAD-IC family P-type ATPase [Candidatus Limnocylindrales bacterium]